jgi:hypothetical protein
VKSRVRIIGNSREPAQRSRKLKKGKLRRGVKQTPVFILGRLLSSIRIFRFNSSIPHRHKGGRHIFCKEAVPIVS